MIDQIGTFFPPCTHKYKANKCDYHKVSLCHSCSLAFHYCCDIKVESENWSIYIKWAIKTFTNLINGVEEEAKKTGMDTDGELLEWIKSEKDKIREVTLEILKNY